MDDRVRELKYEVDEILTPYSQRNDRFAEAMSRRRQAIVDTWYLWIQELFCDAVGFTIGGPSFLYAFSGFLSTRDRGNYYREADELDYSTHPVTWLRVHFLARRLSEAGFTDLARDVENEWRTMARLMKLEEDYHGFYDESLDQAITQTIEDLLTEAGPRPFLDDEAQGNGWSPNSDSLIRLLNWAWQIYLNDSQNYIQWEAEHIKILLG